MTTHLSPAFRGLAAAILTDESTALFDPSIRRDLAISGPTAFGLAERLSFSGVEQVRVPLLTWKATPKAIYRMEQKRAA